MVCRLIEAACRLMRCRCGDGGTPPVEALPLPAGATASPSRSWFAIYLRDVSGIPYDDDQLARMRPDVLYGPEIARKLRMAAGQRRLRLRTAFHGPLNDIQASIRRAQANAERVGLPSYVPLRIEQHFVMAFPNDLRAAIDVLAVLKEWAATRGGFVRVVEPVRRAAPSSRYLDAAPVGTAVHTVRAGGPVTLPPPPAPVAVPLEGAGQKLVVIERGWCPRADVLPLLPATVPDPVDSIEEGPVLHVVATASVILGGRQITGLEGVAPKAEVRKAACISSGQTEQLDMIAAAIRGADLWLQAHAPHGRGVILLEEQDGALMPAECNPDVHNAIQTAVANGHVVIEPAGTQSEPPVIAPDEVNPACIDTMIGQYYVDAVAPATGLTLQSGEMDPEQGWPVSGAVVVAGGQAEGQQAGQLDPLSNFGALVDAWAWGVDIRCEGALRLTIQGVKTWVLDSQPYVFGGSSGAAAIVAGVVLLMQEWRARATPTLLPLTSIQVRELFALHGTPGLGHLLGKRMPDLAALRADVQDGSKFPSVKLVQKAPDPKDAAGPPGPT